MSFLSQISVLEAIKIIEAKAKAPSMQVVDVLESNQRTLFSDLKAKVNHPTHNDSSIDGYACIRKNTLEASEDKPVKLKLVGSSPAGKPFKGKIEENEAINIYTGGVVPDCCDALIRVEDTTEKDGFVFLNKPASRSDIRKMGQDFKVGETVLKKGTVMNSASVALAVAMGHQKIEVSKKPRIAILSTGNEIKEPGKKLKAGQVYNSNAYALRLMAEKAGAEVLVIKNVDDSLEQLKQSIKDAGEVDLILTTGGVSMGKYDFVRDLLFEHGQVDFWKIAEKPGGPVLFGSWNNTPILGIPGNPVSAMVVFLIHAKPFIIKALGSNEAIPFLTREKAIAQTNIKGAGFKMNFSRITVSNTDPKQAYSTGSQSSGVLHSMFLADGLAIVPANTNYVKGDGLEYIPLKPYL